MLRYYDDCFRKMAHDAEKNSGRVVTNEQLRDICKLIREGKRPNGRFADHECTVWELLVTELGMDI